MAYSFTKRKRIRKSFGKIESIIGIPNLIEVQKNSYKGFLQSDIPADQRKEVGLHAVFKAIFPINDYAGISTLEYVKYELDRPKYDVED